MAAASLISSAMSEVPMAGTDAPLGVHPATAGGVPLPSMPLMAPLAELGGPKLVPDPSKAIPDGGGVMLTAAVSYCPTRRLPCGVMASEVTIYTGSTWKLWAFASAQLT